MHGAKVKITVNNLFHVAFVFHFPSTYPITYVPYTKYFILHSHMHGKIHNMGLLLPQRFQLALSRKYPHQNCVCILDLRSTAILPSEGGQFVTDVSEQLVSPIFKGRAVRVEVCFRPFVTIRRRHLQGDLKWDRYMK